MIQEAGVQRCQIRSCSVSLREDFITVVTSNNKDCGFVPKMLFMSCLVKTHDIMIVNTVLIFYTYDGS